MSVLSPTPIFTTPFFTGGVVTSTSTPSEAGGVTRVPPRTIVLDGYVFPIEVAKARIGPLETFRDTIAVNDQPTDTLFSARGAWARYRYSWHHGAGQRMGDLREDADPFRFESSYGIDWATNSYQATLTPASTLVKAAAGATILLQRCGSYLFAASGTDLYRTSDLSSWTTCTAPGGTIQGMTSDGTDLYVTTTTLTTTYVAGATTPTAFGSAPGAGTHIAFVANRLLLAANNVLKEVAAAGTTTTIKTHFQSAFRWTAIFAVGSRIYIGGYAGTRSELYSVTTDSAGALVQSQEAAPLPHGELLRAGIGHAGIAVLATSLGTRVADVSGDGTLTYGPLVHTFGDVAALTAEGSDVWASWHNIVTAGSGVGRMVLDDEVAPLQPAFGADVYQLTNDADVTAVARFLDRTVYAVSGAGIYAGSTTTYVGGGEIRSGRLAFGTVETKVLIGITVSFAPLLDGETIEAYVYNDDGVLIGTGIASALSATELDVDLAGERVAFCTVRIVLSGPGTSTPVLYRWRVRAYPVAPAVIQYILPLIIAEQVLVNAGNGHVRSLNLGDTLDWIRNLYETRTYTILRIGSSEYRVRVDNYEYTPTSWGDSGDYPAGVLVVQLVDA